MTESSSARRTPAQLLAELDTLVTELHTAVRAEDRDSVTEHERVERIKSYQRTISRITAAMSTESDLLHQARTAREKAEKVPTRDRGSTLGQEIGDARGSDTGSANGFLQMSQLIRADMPHAWEAFSTRGVLTEEMAIGLYHELKAYSSSTRRRVDRELAAHYGTISTRKLRAQARALAQNITPEVAQKQREHAVAKRRTGSRPADNGLAWFFALLAPEDAALISKALDAAASSLIATGRAGICPKTGKKRTRDQIKADLLVEWVLAAARGEAPTHGTAPRTRGTARTSGGTKHAQPELPGFVDPTDPTDPTGRTPRQPDIQLHIVMTLEALLGTTNDPAMILGGNGTLPADEVRRLLGNPEVRVFLSRLFQNPDSGQLVTMDTTATEFSAAARRFMLLRDQTMCQHPFCDQPAEVADHIVRRADGGTGSPTNGQYLCAMHNQSKEKLGWRYERTSSGGIQVTSPSGHVIAAQNLPILPGTGQPRRTTPTDEPGPEDDEPPDSPPNPEHAGCSPVRHVH